MKTALYRLIFSFLSCFLPMLTFAQLTEEHELIKDITRVMSYNIRNAKGLDNVTDYARIADVIKTISPDIVALQEIDSVTNRSNKVDVLNEIAKHADMYATYSSSINYNGGKYGIGILSKQKPISSKKIPLPGREEARSLLIVELPDYIFCCTHLSLNEKNRLSSLDIINNEAKRLNKPVILAGDINDRPNSLLINEFQKNWNILSNTNHLTFPADNPCETIDYIFGYNLKQQLFSVLKSVVMDEPIASDHLPVYVDIRLKNQ